MRNLKRALSLTLASVMLLGMMVVGASAKGYPDVSEEDNVEAIEVLQAVQVMRGDDNGDFNPDSPVTRSEMAVIMALLLNLDYQYYEASCPFWDVPTWARGYVGVCYVRGIVAGYSDNTYGAADSVTAVQAAAMMMRALGYFQYDSDYADGFETATVRQGTRIGIFTGVNSNATDPLTRNQVAQMALNALKTPIVEPDDNTISIIDGSGNLIASGGQVNYVVVASNQSYARAIDRTETVGSGLNQVTGYTVELGEQLYNGSLKLNDDIDPFNRPARAWEYDGKTIGQYAKEELMKFEHVGEVTGKDLYDLLGKTIVEDYTLEVALDGVTDPEIVRAVRGYDGDKETLGAKHNQDYVFDANDINRNNKGSVGATGTGVLTQVFVDPDYDNGSSRPDGRVWIAVINTYLARATQDYDTRREELALNAYSVTTSSGEYVKLDKDGAAKQIRLGVEEFPVVEGADKDDAFLVTFAEGEPQSIVPTEVLSGVTISSFKVKDNVVANGTTYKFTTTAGFDADALKAYTGGSQVNLKDITYNIFLDAYGNLIGVQEVDAAKNYVFIAAVDINDSNLVNGTANAKAVFLDGTVDTIRVNMDKSDLDWYKSDATPGGYNKNSILNTWCTYTVNNSDVYTVKQVVDINAKGDTYVPKTANNGTGLAQYHQTGFTNEYTIDKKHITLQGNNTNSGDFARVYGNEDTVYLTAELGNLTNDGGKWGVVKGVDSVTIGAENVNLTVWTDDQAVTEAENSSTPSVSLSGPYKPDYATKGVYTLYDDDGIVIAAMVVGEDEGSARNLVYAHTKTIESESYNGSSAARASGDGMWTWTRKVISNGEEITLTEVSDGNSDLVEMKQYHWYQIKTNGDGEVTGVYKLRDDEGGGNLPNANLDHYDDYALDYLPYTDSEGVTLGEIAYTVQNGASTVLYWNENFIESYLRMNGRTLYVATDDQTGFIVSSNVKWVIQQWDNNKQETYIDEGTTAAGLKNMIDEINRRATVNDVVEDYSYQVSAVIESGIASSVVIYFNENDYTRPGNVVTPTGEAALKWLQGGNWELTVPAGTVMDDLTPTQVRDWLAKAGCTNISMSGGSWNFTIDGTTYNGQNVTVKEKVEPGTTTYTITVAPTTNGKVETDPEDEAAATTEVTVTATPTNPEEYELEKITVTRKDEDGNDVEITVDDGKFIMPAADVTVTVSFKKINPGDSVIVSPKGTALADNHYSMTGLDADNEIAIGETFTINALKKIIVYVDSERTVVAKGGTLDVTAAEDLSVVINRTKLEPGENNSMVETEDTDADTPVIPQSLARFARTVRAAEDNYQKMIITDVDGVDHEYIVKVVTDADGMDTIYFPTAESVAEAVKILNDADLANVEAEIDFDTATDEEIEENWGEGDVTPADDRCQAVINDDDSITINVYKGFEPTEDQIKAAIAKATGKDLTSEDVDISDTTNVVIGKESGFTLAEAQGEMIKVTIQDKAADKEIVKYALPSTAITDLPETILALVPAGKIVSDAETATAVADKAVEVTDSSATLPALTADTTYVSALKLWKTAGGGEKLYYANGEATGYTEITSLSTQKYVQVKAPLMVRLTSLNAGAKGGITINGVDYIGTADAQGNLEIPVNDLVGYAEGQTALTVAAYTPADAYTVKINGETISNPATEDGKWFVNDVITLTTPVTSTLIAGKQCASAGTTKTEALPGSDYKKIQITGAVAAGANASTGVLELNTAYTIAAITFDTDFTLADPKAGDGGITLAANDLIAEGYELTLTAKDAGETAKVKDGSKYTLGTPTWNEAGKAVYTIEVTADISSTEFAKGLVVTTTGLGAKELVAVPSNASGDAQDIEDGASVGGSIEIAVPTGLTASTQVEYEWSSKGGSSELKKLTINKPTIDTTNKKIVFTFTNNSGGTITLDSTSSNPTSGIMIVTIEDVVVEVTIKVAKGQ